MFKKALSDHAERVKLALGAADQEKVRLIAEEDAISLTQSQQAGNVACRNGVIWSAGIVQDRDMASEHVRQVFEHPQRLNERNALLAPFFQIDMARLAIGADTSGIDEVAQFGGNQSGAKLDAEACGIEFAFVYFAVIQSALRPRD